MYLYLFIQFYNELYYIVIRMLMHKQSYKSGPQHRFCDCLNGNIFHSPNGGLELLRVLLGTAFDKRVACALLSFLGSCCLTPRAVCSLTVYAWTCFWALLPSIVVCAS